MDRVLRRSIIAKHQSDHHDKIKEHLDNLVIKAKAISNNNFLDEVRQEITRLSQIKRNRNRIKLIGFMKVFVCSNYNMLDTLSNIYLQRPVLCFQINYDRPCLFGTLGMSEDALCKMCNQIYNLKVYAIISKPMKQENKLCCMSHLRFKDALIDNSYTICVYCMLKVSSPCCAKNGKLMKVRQMYPAGYFCSFQCQERAVLRRRNQ